MTFEEWWETTGINCLGMQPDDVYRAARDAALSAWTEAAQDARGVLIVAEAALADIGDAERMPGDDLEWCETRAAQALTVVRSALANC